MKNPYKLNVSQYSTHRALLDAIGENKTVLDVGCNDGYIGKLADKSNTFYGLDYLPESVALAKKVYADAIEYDLNDIKPLPWKQQFDVIIFADVLEHILLPEPALKYFVDNYLKPDGVVVISLPNIANWQVRWNLLWGNFDYVDGSGIMDKTHLHLYTFKTARELVEAGGLVVDKFSYGASFFGPIIQASGGLLRNVLSTGIIMLCKKPKSS